MTSINHTGIASAVAIAAVNSDSSTKVLIIVALALSHVVADAIPHLHYYGFGRLKETWLGAMFELGVGFLLLPAIVYHLTGINLVWLTLCILSASLVDFLVAANIKPVVRLNEVAHWWDKRVPQQTVVVCEILQTIIIFRLLFAMIR